ncbi:hypothetical protein V502_00511 [Pseudogymnoascus sp. VKM F-4520 (FW-2644)]|nr:hypothetical protein V502_00511 [Pseudogymnoascus sp. VKM F-4520 (FW-2644)]
MGIGKRGNQVNVIDFGLATKYRDPVNSVHMPYSENNNFTGEARYASIKTHLGAEQSRRDDMELVLTTSPTIVTSKRFSATSMPVSVVGVGITDRDHSTQGHDDDEIVQDIEKWKADAREQRLRLLKEVPAVQMDSWFLNEHCGMEGLRCAAPVADYKEQAEASHSIQP